jgi:hypothetical protein
MARHTWSTVALLVMVVFAFGSVSGKKPSDSPAPSGRTWPYEFVSSKADPKDSRNVMDLYAFSGNLDPAELREFCRERKRSVKGELFYYVVIFDAATNARYPSNPFTAEFGLDEGTTRYIRAIYTYNQKNGFSEVRFHPQNIWDHKVTTERI